MSTLTQAHEGGISFRQMNSLLTFDPVAIKRIAERIFFIESRFLLPRKRFARFQLHEESMGGFDPQADSFDAVQVFVTHTLANAEGVLPFVGEEVARTEGNIKVVDGNAGTFPHAIIVG